MKGRIVAAAAVLLLLLCAVPAWAVPPEEVEDALSPDAQALLEQLDEDTADSGTLSKGVAKLWLAGALSAAGLLIILLL